MGMAKVDLFANDLATFIHALEIWKQQLVPFYLWWHVVRIPYAHLQNILVYFQAPLGKCKYSCLILSHILVNNTALSSAVLPTLTASDPRVSG